MAANRVITSAVRFELIADVLDMEVRPGLKLDGGDLELERIEGSRVVVRLKGACTSCASSEATMRYFIEDKLRELVDPGIEVVKAE